MCYNYENKTPGLFKEVLTQLGLKLIEAPNIDFPLDVKPTDQILTLVKKKNQYHLANTTWGIQYNQNSPKIFNSRIETIKVKPYGKKLFNNNRALLPMTGFYEWTGKKGKKVRHKIVLPEEEFFIVPALYHIREGDIFTSLVTVPANEFIREIHHRMPAILKPKDAIRILDYEIDEVIEMCEPYKGEMKILNTAK